MKPLSPAGPLLRIPGNSSRAAVRLGRQAVKSLAARFKVQSSKLRILRKLSELYPEIDISISRSRRIPGRRKDTVCVHNARGTAGQYTVHSNRLAGAWDGIADFSWPLTAREMFAPS